MKEEIQKIKKASLSENIPIIRDEALDVIRKILIENKPERVLEIGTGTGYSAICFYDILNTVGSGFHARPIHIDTIELDELRANEAIANIKSLKLENNINVMIGDAVEILPKINKKYDMVFIDASKTKYPVFLENAIRLTNPGSVIIADNVLYYGYVMGDYNKHKQRTAVKRLREYLKEAQENPHLETEILDVGDGLAVSRVR